MTQITACAPEPPAPPLAGLSEAEARERLSRDGPNALPEVGRADGWARILAPLREPAYQLLLAAGVIYLILGDRIEGALLFAVASLAAGLEIAQDYRTERTLQRLRDLSAPRAMVRREGQLKRIPAREVVIGDIVLLQAGDRAPADGALMESHGLTADESLMTGESTPAEKHTEPTEAELRTALTRPDIILGGALIVSGEGVMRVTATGARSRMGQIGLILAGAQFEAPRLTVQMRRVVQIFAVLAVFASVSLTVGLRLSGAAWLEAALNGLALAIALVPEEIPLILTVFTVMGALRIARAGVLARQAAAIETLGQTTVLCVDKTGTLTENRMRVVAVWAPEQGPAEADPAGRTKDTALQRGAALACGPATTDPMELAILHAAGPMEALPRLQSWPFDRALLAMGNLYTLAGGKRLFVKGAPEAVIPWAVTDPAERERVADAASDMARRGMRVIAVAEGAPPPADDALTGASVTLTGLIGLADPLRAAAPDIVARFRQAGVRVVMITGDHPHTAAAIAGEAGLETADRVLEGAALEALSETERAEAAAGTSVFARIQPEQKLLIVQALKAAGETVAMVGDGVNDAPALKAAHIGVAMGARGSDVAREAAALVLVKDDLAALADAFRLGRRITDNIRKALAYIFSIHAVIAGAALIPVLLGWPPLLLPLHVVIIEFVIDPVCAVVLEADREAEDIMRRPPRRRGQPLFGLPAMLASATLGLIALAAVIGVYGFTLRTGGEPAARATAFLAIMMLNAGLLLTTRARGFDPASLMNVRNPFLWPALLAILALGALFTLTSAIARFLMFDTPDLLTAAAAVAAALALILVAEEGFTLLRRNRRLTRIKQAAR